MTDQLQYASVDYKALRQAMFEAKSNKYEELTTDIDTIFHYFWMQAQLTKFSVNNVLLILHQRTGASDVRTFEDWAKEGLSVKKGEQAIRIFEPEKREDGKTGFKVASVFDITQTTGEYVWNPICDHPLTHVKALTLVAGCEMAHFPDPNFKYPVSYIPEKNIFAIRLSDDHALLMKYAAENAVYRLREQNKLPYYLKDDKETKTNSARLAAQLYICRYGIRDTFGLTESMQTLAQLDPGEREEILGQARKDFLYVMEHAEALFPDLSANYPLRDETLEGNEI